MDYTKIARQIYPDLIEADTDYFYGPSNYQPILRWLGSIAIQVDDNDYQGDSRILYRYWKESEGTKFGYLDFGWGSCSGCDSLQSCSSYEEIGSLIKELQDRIMWNSTEGMLKFFETHDWEGDYSYTKKEQKQFIEMVKAYLKVELGG